MVVVSAVAFRGKGTAIAWCAEIGYTFESSSCVLPSRNSVKEPRHRCQDSDHFAVLQIFSYGGTRTQTGDTMIFSHVRRVSGCTGGFKNGLSRPNSHILRCSM